MGHLGDGTLMEVYHLRIHSLVLLLVCFSSPYTRFQMCISSHLPSPTFCCRASLKLPSLFLGLLGKINLYSTGCLVAFDHGVLPPQQKVIDRKNTKLCQNIVPYYFYLPFLSDKYFNLKIH